MVNPWAPAQEKSPLAPGRQGRHFMAFSYQCTPVKNAVINWERIPCPLCNASDEDIFLQARADPDQTLYRLVRCRSCGMVYMNPRPDEASIGQFYPDDYEA